MDKKQTEKANVLADDYYKAIRGTDYRGNGPTFDATNMRNAYLSGYEAAFPEGEESGKDSQGSYQYGYDNGHSDGYDEGTSDAQEG